MRLVSSSCETVVRFRLPVVGEGCAGKVGGLGAPFVVAMRRTLRLGYRIDVNKPKFGEC